MGLEINGIPVKGLRITGSGGACGPDLSSATATPEDILQGKTAFTGAGKITGTYTPESGETEQKPCTITIQNNSRIPTIQFWYNTGSAVSINQILKSDSKEITVYPGMLFFYCSERRGTNETKAGLKAVSSNTTKVGIFRSDKNTTFAGDYAIDGYSLASPVFNLGGNVSVTITDAE